MYTSSRKESIASKKYSTPTPEITTAIESQTQNSGGNKSRTFLPQLSPSFKKVFSPSADNKNKSSEISYDNPLNAKSLPEVNNVKTRKIYESVSVADLAQQGQDNGEKKIQSEMNANNVIKRKSSATHQSFSSNSSLPLSSPSSSAGTTNSMWSLSSSSSSSSSVSSHPYSISSSSRENTVRRRTLIPSLGGGSRRTSTTATNETNSTTSTVRGSSRKGPILEAINTMSLTSKISIASKVEQIPLYLNPKSVVGLANLGNTCFMNSILQCLLWSPGLVPFFIDNLCGKGSTKSNVICGTSPLKGNLAKAYALLLGQCTQESSGGYVSPQIVKKVIAKWAPQFLGYDQHDSQEFMHYFLDGLGEDLNRNTNDQRMLMRKLNEAKALEPDVVQEKWDIEKLADDAWYRYSLGNASIITDLFTGQLLSKVECLKCGYISYCVDPFLDVSLPIPKQTSTQATSAITGAGHINEFRRRTTSIAPSQVDLESCFRLFNSKETLDGDEKVKCVRCKEHQDSYKTLYLHRLPPLLVIHIKRFSNLGYRRRKLDTTITNFLSIDVRPFLHENIKAKYNGVTMYDLYGVSNHMGSLGGGHYTAHCKIPEGSCGSTIIRKSSSASLSQTTRRQSSVSEKESDWYLFDDSRTTPASTSTLSGSAAYLLFYKKR